MFEGEKQPNDFVKNMGLILFKCFRKEVIAYIS